ncbi:hypothetical protein [Aquibacillus rhizosphaerae]|uniref:DUF4367 domain-containing protein n=1 Tax=Aquibacillus rhizosphaerae TaxID=3051431 RepID=A0ABT7L2R9_9BACI|nr:hypothetical protein [Aquibacillus sp. LR5S19]MDL4838896.1 hypothetical protein [Aquibacillus sp. LR5S19]
MKKMGLPLSLIVLLLALSVSGIDKGYSNVDKIKVPKDVSMIKVTGLTIYSETKNRLSERKIVFEQIEEIEVLLKAIEDSTPYSGPTTSEGETHNLIITYTDTTSETIHLWLYPDRNSGRIQRKNYEGPIQILSKDDVQNIARILAKKNS